MTANAALFERELEISRTEAAVGLQYYYTFLGIHATLSDQNELLHGVNQNPLFWNTVSGALHSATFIALGRRFDQSSPHNIDKLVKIAENNASLFSKGALAGRKQKQSANAEEWLPKFLEDVYEPKVTDFRKMRAFVNKYRTVYNEKYRDIRHKTIAHLELAEHRDIQTLYGKTNVAELGTLLSSMMHVYDVLWELYYNGRQPQWDFVAPSADEVVKADRSYKTSAGKLPERAVLDAQAVIRSIGHQIS